MYTPAHFEESRPEVLHGLIARHPMGTLVTHGAKGMDANHLPFELRAQEGAQGVLHCHVARANPVWQELANGDEVLVIFRAGDAYISPQWYPSKQELHRQVPTWNYLVAHAHGRVTIRDDERYVRGMVGRLTRTHEAGQPVPWKMTDAEGKAKLSQNKEARDIQGAGEALAARGERLVGEAMLAAASARRTG
jgi:transcriptional regulator